MKSSKTTEKATEASLRKRRGVVKASLTRMSTRVGELEPKYKEPATRGHAQRMLERLGNLDSEFKGYHYELLDLIDDEEALQVEQEALDLHNDGVAQLHASIEALLALCSPYNPRDDQRKLISKKLTHIGKRTDSIGGAVSSFTEETEACLVQEYGEQVLEVKVKLSSIREEMLPLDLEEEDELITLLEHLERKILESSLSIKRFTSHSTTKGVATVPPSAEGNGVRLPKLAVPRFDGNITNWITFWEQFRVSIHDRTNLSNAEKLAYLRHSVKDGSARDTIEGLLRTGDCYEEAVKSLEDRYNRPRLIHQTHVKMIVEATPLKTGNGQELRKLHDTVQQHLRALKAMGHEPSTQFVTSMIELKLDTNTMFEWQRHTQDSTDVPEYKVLLDFLNLRAQACEASATDKRESKNDTVGKRAVTKKASFHSATYAETGDSSTECIACKNKHPLYVCPQFRSLDHDKMVSLVKAHNYCMNCLRPGHFVKKCRSIHRCKHCQMTHHTLLHIDRKTDASTAAENVSNAASCKNASSLLMTCRILVHPPGGTPVEARALLDSGSSTSFVSERLSQSLSLARLRNNTKIHGIAGLSRQSPFQAVVNLIISPIRTPKDVLEISAIVLPKVTCDLPLSHVKFKPEWKHLSDLPLADPEFGRPHKIDVLLGVDIFLAVLLQGRRRGPPASPVALETRFGWVLAGTLDTPDHTVVSHFVTMSGDEILTKFWKLEEHPNKLPNLTVQERTVVQHFAENHCQDEEGRFIVPLPKDPEAKPIGESRSQAVRRLLALERSLKSKGESEEFNKVIQEYFDLGHAEQVPTVDLNKSTDEVYYMPLHAVKKESSTTTKMRAVFDASAKGSTGVSLNDTLLVGPTIHAPLVDVLLRFRLHRIALTSDISKMYRAVLLCEPDKDLHRFVWRRSQEEPIRDYRMTRVTFGVSASSYAANMSVKQNSLNLATKYPLAVRAVERSFYVDDCLSGADTTCEAISLYQQLFDSFKEGGFLLRKWISSDPEVTQQIPAQLRGSSSVQIADGYDQFTKTLGVEWNSAEDYFKLTIASLPPLKTLTKRMLVSDVAKIFDALGWFSPSTVLMKMLLQKLWELRLEWDDLVPDRIRDSWMQWRTQLELLAGKRIPRCYFDKSTHIIAMELHGFADASERAYAAVVYLRMVDTSGHAQVSLVMSKTKVAPIKKVTIPRLELCGAVLLANLMHHLLVVLDIPSDQAFAWTDSTIVLSWLSSEPRRFKTFVANRVSQVSELIHPSHWNHVRSEHNPADCASRGMYPSELLEHKQWWNGPEWLSLDRAYWPSLEVSSDIPPTEEIKKEFLLKDPCDGEVALHAIAEDSESIVPVNQYSSFTRLKRITAWMFRFLSNCGHKRLKVIQNKSPTLTTSEMVKAESYWIKLVQNTCFSEDLSTLKQNRQLRGSSSMLSLHPFVDSSGILRVGGRENNSNRPFSSQHPVILSGKHPITKLLIHTEHIRLLHAGVTLLTCSLSRRYHILECRKYVRSVTRGCVPCRRLVAKPQSQLIGQLPIERVTPDSVFDKVGVDYAGPIYVKHGHVRKPTVVKAYIAVFVSLTVKAVHLEIVSDLTTDCFLAALRRFISRRGKPSVIWSDNGSNFVGAARELKDLTVFLNDEGNQSSITDFCTSQVIHWKFTPERAPHFGGLWEAAVKSMKHHLRHIASTNKLTLEEYSTVLSQIESCLNSRPLVPLPHEDDGVEALTPGHFLIGRPMESLPDPSFSYKKMSILKRWHLCQALVRQFWQRWSAEYVSALRSSSKWHRRSNDIQVGDLVLIQEDNLVPTKWPLARVIETHPGKDNIVRVVTVKTQHGVYKRPTAKVALLLSPES